MPSKCLENRKTQQRGHWIGMMSHQVHLVQKTIKWRSRPAEMQEREGRLEQLADSGRGVAGYLQKCRVMELIEGRQGSLVKNQAHRCQPYPASPWSMEQPEL